MIIQIIAVPYRYLLLAITLLLLTGCTTGTVTGSSPLARLAALETPGILTLDADARHFIDSSVAGIRTPYERIRALRKAVFAPDGLHFDLDEDRTLSANQAFHQAGGNCVALANFFVAALRYLGIDAHFQETGRQVGKDAGDLRVVARHINVSGTLIWHHRQARYVLDYLAVPDEDFKHATVISDRRAFAHYYNNIGARYLQRGDLETALQYLKLALQLDADTDFVWTNLGVVYTHRGNLEAAEFAYRQALALNRDNTSARNNLATLKNQWHGHVRRED